MKDGGFPRARWPRDNVDSRDELDVEVKSEVSNVDVCYVLSKPCEGSVPETEKGRVGLRSKDAFLIELVEDFGLGRSRRRNVSYARVAGGRDKEGEELTS